LKHLKKEYAPIFSQPAATETIEVAKGIFWLRFSLPFALDHINIWLLDGGDAGWSIIDSGFHDAATHAQWEAVFADRLFGKPVETLFMTHFHPDHFGLAGRLQEKTGAPIEMTPGEWRMVQTLTDEDSVERLEQLYRPYYTHAGVAEDVLEKLLNRRTGYRNIIHPPPSETMAVHPGQNVSLGGRLWQIIGGYGHSPEHASLYNAEDNILIAGDMVLPFITPNISFFPGNPPGHDPVDLYMETLLRIRATVPDNALILPSHGIPFSGLHDRIDAILAHHDRGWINWLRYSLAARKRAIRRCRDFLHTGSWPPAMFFSRSAKQWRIWFMACAAAMWLKHLTKIEFCIRRQPECVQNTPKSNIITPIIG